MSRKIKFRAWDKENKEMFDLDIGGVDFQNFNLNEYIKELQEDTILMQFIGLKDKNGKEIYEGDIVRYAAITGWSGAIVGPCRDKQGNVWEIFTGVVKYGESNFFIDGCRYQRTITNLKEYDGEVIGNIYEI